MPSDKFANIAFVSVVESAINTLTFRKLETAVSVYEKVAWLISRIEYFININTTTFAATGDSVIFGLTTSNTITAINIAQNAVFDYFNLARFDFGTAASGELVTSLRMKDLSTLPGGGLLVPPNPIYLGVQGAAAPAVFTVEARIFFTVVTMKTEDFWELVEMRRMIGT